MNDEQGARAGEQDGAGEEHGAGEEGADAGEQAGRADASSRRSAEHERRRRLAEAFGDPLPESTRDERDGWGERPQVDRRRQDDWFRDQVPPHHG